MTTKLSETGRARLTRLAEFLPTVKEDKFNIQLWTNKDGRDFEVDCGFVGCSMGWAATEPSFKAEGLHLAYSRQGYEVGVLYKRSWGIAAAMKFFEISEEEAYDLFTSSGPFYAGYLNNQITPTVASEAIKKFLKEHD